MGELTFRGTQIHRWLCDRAGDRRVQGDPMIRGMELDGLV
jgi:hypothetical protein